jgi:phosphoglycerate kinase
MDVINNIKIRSIEEFEYNNKTVLLRLDINSTIDHITKKIKGEKRIDMSLKTIQYLLDNGAKIAIIAHQGDTLDYFNLISMEEHAEKLSNKLGIKVKYIDDVCGPFALESVKNLKKGEIILLGNLRYLTEEVSTFESVVNITPDEMIHTWLVRMLAPIFDIYINEAFSAAHRNSPSMVAFQELLPTAGGFLLLNEIEALTKVMTHPKNPSIFVLGGLKISDAFGMMKTVLENGSCDKVLSGGVVGHIMLIAAGYNIGEENIKFIKERGLQKFIEPATEYLSSFTDKILYPIDLAYNSNNLRMECDIKHIVTNTTTMDIGKKTIEIYKDEILNAGTIFVNGPMGVYENSLFNEGTREIWNAISNAKGYSVIGGGDTISAAQSFINLDSIGYVCTAGGAMVNFLSGKELPLIKAMIKASVN